MTETSELRAGEVRLREMKADADHARRRYDLYKAKSYSSRPSSPKRLRDLQRESERAASRLNRAKANA
jgi:hypothetical protein